MTSVTTAVAETAQTMLDELHQHALEVILTPAPEARHDGHMVRTVIMRNPDWYRQLCDDHPSHRTRPRRRHKPDTRIKRAHTLRALAEIAGGHCVTDYAHRLLPYVTKQHQHNLELAQWRLSHAEQNRATNPAHTPARPAHPREESGTWLISQIYR